MLAGVGTFILILLGTGTVIAVCVAILIRRDYVRQCRIDEEAKKLIAAGHLLRFPS